jgi:CheY-like chemotaxis protein
MDHQDRKPMKKKIVLYAEDELSNRKLVHVKLEKAGIQCDLVEDGLKAVEKCKSNQYDLIILDYYMPGMDGIDAAKEIRDFSSNIPIFAITSDDSKESQLFKAGFDEVFIKPVHGQELIETVKSYLSQTN